MADSIGVGSIKEKKFRDDQYKQRILLVHNYYQIPGGEDTVVVNEKKLLEDHGHRVFLYTRDNKELQDFSLFQKLMLPINTVFSIKTYREVCNMIRKYRIDVVHVHNTLNLISPSVFYAAFSCKVPVVNTLHNFRLQCPAGTFYRNHHVCEDCMKYGLSCSVKHGCYRGSRLQTLASALTIGLHRFLGTYRKINFICLTEFNKRKLLELNHGKRKVIDERKVFVKPNFTPEADDCKGESVKFELSNVTGDKNVPEGDDRPNSRIKKSIDGLKDKQYYAFVGRVEEIKGIRLLVKAFEKSGKFLVVVGDGDDSKKINGYLHRKKISNIIMLGRQERDTVNVIMAHAKAVIVPSLWYETFGMVVIEAYACRTPVIAADFGNVGDLIEDGRTGFQYRQGSPDALNLAMERMERLNPEEYERMRQAAYHAYLERYSAEKNYDILNEIYERVGVKSC